MTIHLGLCTNTVASQQEGHGPVHPGASLCAHMFSACLYSSFLPRPKDTQSGWLGILNCPYVSGQEWVVICLCMLPFDGLVICPEWALLKTLSIWVSENSFTGTLVHINNIISRNIHMTGPAHSIPLVNHPPWRGHRKHLQGLLICWEIDEPSSSPPIPPSKQVTLFYFGGLPIIHFLPLVVWQKLLNQTDLKVRYKANKKLKKTFNLVLKSRFVTVFSYMYTLCLFMARCLVVYVYCPLHSAMCAVFIMCRELHSVPALPGPVLHTDTEANWSQLALQRVCHLFWFM